jgi:NTP pyrophosphatase (non-canonical NTP hydrolase)
LAGRLAETWVLKDSLRPVYGNSEEALEAALKRSQEALQTSLGDCLTFTLRLANRLEIDLEGTYLRRLREAQPPDSETGSKETT